ncbi:MAG TPA: hypothetical protein ACFYEJ_11270 [Candidatus Wujingus californicus]
MNSHAKDINVGVGRNLTAREIAVVHCMGISPSLKMLVASRKIVSKSS